MKYRVLGRTGYEVSTISFGAWAIGGTWGPVDDEASLDALRRAVELGVNFFDTADVYGDGRSERLLARLRHDYSHHLYIATKAGRRLQPHVPEGYNRENLTMFVERSLINLKTDALDLLQLHCPPTQVFYMPEVFGILDDLTASGKIRHYGISVEKVEEGLKAIEYENVQSVQIVFNMFRPRPSELFFAQAIKRRVGIMARLPLASGLLTGKFTPVTQFDSDDHRSFNRQGEQFDRGETFSGIDYDLGLRAVAELKSICPPGMSLAQFALNWILRFDAVTCAIPGAKRRNQVEENIVASDLPLINDTIMEKVHSVYERLLHRSVHPFW
jgi:aryl-alcohol dehydrogenase-like predicted oxidoreductase